MFSRTQTAILAVLLIGISAVLPAAAGGASLSSTTSSESVASSSTTAAAVEHFDATAPENNTTTTVNLTAEEVTELIQTGQASAAGSTERVSDWLAANAGNLSNEQAAVAFRWLLARSAVVDNATVDPALRAVGNELPTERSRSIVERVRDSLPTGAVEDLRSDLAGLGSSWSLDISGWLSSPSSTNTTTTTTAPTTTTTTEPTSTPTTSTAPDDSSSEDAASSDESGDYADAGYGAVEADRGDVAMNSTLILRELAPGLAVREIRYKDGYALVELTNARPEAVRLTVTDSNSYERGAETFEITEKTFTLPTGRFTLKIPAEKDRQYQQIVFSAGVIDNPVGFSNQQTGGGPLPWDVGGTLVGWAGGVSAVGISGLMAYRRSENWDSVPVEDLEDYLI
jgi:hypothetical protein